MIICTYSEAEEQNLLRVFSNRLLKRTFFPLFIIFIACLFCLFIKKSSLEVYVLVGSAYLMYWFLTIKFVIYLQKKKCQGYKRFKVTLHEEYLEFESKKLFKKDIVKSIQSFNGVLFLTEKSSLFFRSERMKTRFFVPCVITNYDKVIEWSK